jgi:hypothetical protein
MVMHSNFTVVPDSWQTAQQKALIAKLEEDLAATPASAAAAGAVPLGKVRCCLLAVSADSPCSPATTCFRLSSASATASGLASIRSRLYESLTLLYAASNTFYLTALCFFQEASTLTSTADRLRADAAALRSDNVKLYAKIRYLEAYAPGKQVFLSSILMPSSFCDRLISRVEILRLLRRSTNRHTKIRSTPSTLSARGYCTTGLTSLTI